MPNEPQEIMLLGGLTTDYAEDSGAFIIPALISKGLYAINDVNPIYNPVDLELGTNGSINLLVGANTGNYQKPEYGISITGEYLNDKEVYNFQVNNENAIALSPNDFNSTVYLGDAIIYSDADYVYLTSHTKTFSFGDLHELQLTNLHTLKNIKVDGQVYAPEYNITKDLINSNQLGYAFRIGKNNHLELIKYIIDNNNSSSSTTQLVASFGSYDTINDSEYTHNTYVSSESTDQDQNNQNTQQSITRNGYWFANGNDIYFGIHGGTSEKVGINTSNPQAELDVVGEIKGSKITDGTIVIANGYIHNIQQISVDSGHAYGGILFKNITEDAGDYMWSGRARDLFELDEVRLSFLTNDLNLSHFYRKNNHTWFDSDQEYVLLSQFSNDLMNYDNPSFCNCYIASNLHSSNLVSSNLHIDNNAIIKSLTSDLNIVNIQYTSNLTSSNIYSSNVSTQLIHASNVNIYNDLNVTYDVNTSLLRSSNISCTNTINSTNVSASNIVIKTNLDGLNATFSNITTTTLTSTQAGITEMISSLTPNTSYIHNLGQYTKSWNTTYTKNIVLSETNSIRFGGESIGMSIEIETSEAQETIGEKFLNIKGGTVLTNGITFRDGTQIQSTNDIISAVNEGELFGDFSGFSMLINSQKRTEFFSGSYMYSLNHNIAKFGNEWEILELTNRSILPMQSDGSGIDKQLTQHIKTGGNPKDVQMSFVHDGRLVGDHLYLVSTGKSNVNDFFPIRNFDPYSKFFQNKCKADFLYYHNIREVENNRKSKDIAIYSGDYDKSYVQIASLSAFNTRNSGNKFYDIEVLYYHKAPLFDVKFIINNMSNKYLISNDAITRLTQAYVFDEATNTYILDDINSNYGLYPKIAIQKWNNSMNNVEFSEVIYDTVFGWGGPDLSTVFNKFKSNGWLKVLFEITYKYIQYGIVIGLFETDSVLQNIDQYVDSLTENDIIFTDENNIVYGDVLIENKTIICLKRNVFLNIIT